MRIVIVSDAWLPQVNGVVRTLQTLKRHLIAQGDEVTFITPDQFRTMPCPTYPEIRLALFPNSNVKKLMDGARPQAVHIATEGPLGWAARAYCLKNGLSFTTAYHTRFPEYVHARCRLPLSISYGVVRKFHGRSSCMMVATDSLQNVLRARGFDNIRTWTRGIDTDLFQPDTAAFPVKGLKPPFFLYVGRIAVEKNISAFLDLDLPGTKVVVGDGPQLEKLRQGYPDVHFAGVKEGPELAAYYAASDVFVFPSKTDTFGLVLLEALACGVPVAAFPVTGPLDVIGTAPVGVLDTDLGKAARAALEIDRQACREFALKFSWDKSTRQFRDNLVSATRLDGPRDQAAD